VSRPILIFTFYLVGPVLLLPQKFLDQSTAALRLSPPYIVAVRRSHISLLHITALAILNVSADLYIAEWHDILSAVTTQLQVCQCMLYPMWCATALVGVPFPHCTTGKSYCKFTKKKKILFYGTWRFIHYCLHKGPLLDPILSHFNSVPDITALFSKIQ
jgi:hypothetical protein